MKSKVILISTLAFLFISNISQAQVIGKIISKSEANTLLGSVIESKPLDVSLIESVIQNTKNVVMFIIKNNCVAIKGDDGSVIYNDGIQLESTSVFMRYSKSIVVELLSSKNQSVFVEKRKDAISLTSGENTLEFGVPCPPDCD